MLRSLESCWRNTGHEHLSINVVVVVARLT